MNNVEVFLRNYEGGAGTVIIANCDSFTNSDYSRCRLLLTLQSLLQSLGNLNLSGILIRQIKTHVC